MMAFAKFSTLPTSWGLPRALSRMRHQDRRRRLWIDAICINQEDLVERAAQVNMMEFVYQRSEGNLTDLGEDNGTVGQVISMIKTAMREVKIVLGGKPGVDFDYLDGCFKEVDSLQREGC